MPNKSDIFKYLVRIGEAEEASIPSSFESDDTIAGVNLDEEAQRGELAWLSRSKLSRKPECLNNFAGSLLIVPEGITVPDDPESRFIACQNPKLAFIKVVAFFFPELAHTEWPSVKDHPIHPGTRLGSNVTLAHGVVIGSRVIIEDEVSIGPNTVIANCTIKSMSSIGANCSIGLPGFGYGTDKRNRHFRFPHMGRVIIEEDVEIGSNTCIDRGSIGNTIICKGARVDNLVHIAHNVTVGANSFVIANSMIGGSAVVGENVWVAPSVSIMNQISVGDQALLGMGAVVLRDVAEQSIFAGNPARFIRKNLE